MDKFFTTSQVARELGVSVDWLREAEYKGKIPKAKRSMSGWRLYTDEDIAKLRELLVPMSGEAWITR